MKKIYELKNISFAETGENGYYIVSRTIQKNGDMQIFFKSDFTDPVRVDTIF